MTNRSYTQEKIKVMQAFIDGQDIEKRVIGDGNEFVSCVYPNWYFGAEEYRIEPVPRTRYFIEFKDGRLGASYEDKGHCLGVAKNSGDRVLEFVEVMK